MNYAVINLNSGLNAHSHIHLPDYAKIPFKDQRGKNYLNRYKNPTKNENHKINDAEKTYKTLEN